MFISRRVAIAGLIVQPLAGCAFIGDARESFRVFCHDTFGTEFEDEVDYYELKKIVDSEVDSLYGYISASTDLPEDDLIYSIKKEKIRVLIEEIESEGIVVINRPKYGI